MVQLRPFESGVERAPVFAEYTGARDFMNSVVPVVWARNALLPAFRIDT